MSRFFANLWMILTADCELSARLTSDSFDRQLSWAERMAVRLHRLICSKSRNLNRQMELLHKACTKFAWQASQVAGSTQLPPDAKERIRQRLAREQE